jgi:hypothetical protein
MAIVSSPFGGVTLTGEDAAAFRRQVVEAAPNPLALESVRRGLALARQIKDSGVARISL